MTREEKIKELAEIYVERGLTIEDLIDMAIDYGETIPKLKEHYENAVKFVAKNIDKDEYDISLKRMNKWRCSIDLANEYIADQIAVFMDEYGDDNNLTEDWWRDFGDVDDIFWELEI